MTEAEPPPDAEDKDAEDKDAEDKRRVRPSNGDDKRAFAFAAVAGFGVALVALALAALFKTPLLPQVTGGGTPFLGALAVGIVGAAPLIGLLIVFMRIDYGPIAAFREEQITFLSTLGFKLTPWRIILISALAGLGEELLFRGVFQTALSAHAPLVAAIILPNILFGFLHARTLTYALIAAGAGVYFGVLFAATGALIAPIIAHALYDYAALSVARQAINARNA